MGRATFYHLTRSAPEALVPRLVARAQDAGWSVELRSTDARALQRLDDQLWLHEGFIAHGMAGGQHDDRQPILLTLMDPQAAGTSLPANKAAYIIALDGAPVSPEICAQVARVAILFDSQDDAALNVARGQWRALTGAGHAAEYWSETSGRWVKERSTDGD